MTCVTTLLTTSPVILFRCCHKIRPVWHIAKFTTRNAFAQSPLFSSLITEENSHHIPYNPPILAVFPQPNPTRLRHSNSPSRFLSLVEVPTHDKELFLEETWDLAQDLHLGRSESYEYARGRHTPSPTSPTTTHAHGTLYSEVQCRKVLCMWYTGIYDAHRVFW